MSAILAFALMLAPQAAPSAADLADGKCAGLLMLAIEELKDEKEKVGATFGMTFYIGKIVGRSGQAAVKPAIAAALGGIDPDSVAKDVPACLDQMTRAMDSLG